MKKLTLIIVTLIFTILNFGCVGELKNTTALDEQSATEKNQRQLLTKQPPPSIEWSLERDNLTNRFKLQNDRGTTFFMYVFIEGVGQPIGYYQVNKVSSVDSQLTNPNQVVTVCGNNIGCTRDVLPSPSEDGSYGTNGDGVFGFTPEGVYIETNMRYLVATVPLNFEKPVTRLAVINSQEAEKLLENSKKVLSK